MVQGTATLLAEVAVDQEEAERVRAVVSKEESEVKSKAAVTQALADEAKVDLDQALPALNAAVDSLNSLNKGDIVEIKSMLKPPQLVQMTMEVGGGCLCLPVAAAVCVAKLNVCISCPSLQPTLQIKRCRTFDLCSDSVGPAAGKMILPRGRGGGATKVGV